MRLDWGCMMVWKFVFWTGCGGDSIGTAGCCPNEVAVPMNCGGKFSQSSLKLSPSPNEVVAKWSELIFSKKLLSSLLSVSESNGAPGAGSGGSKNMSS